MRSDLFTAVLFTALISAFVILADFFCCPLMFQQYKSSSFNETTGIILTNDFQFRTRTTTASKYGSMQTKYKIAVIRYSFSANGRQFLGTRFRYFNYSAADEIANNPVGAQIPVFFDPKNPQNAVLSKGLNQTDKIIAGVLTILNLFVAVLISLSFRKIQKRNA